MFGETVLVVEDEAVFRGFLVILLETAGYQTIEAENGARALELINANHEIVDLVLLDRDMPNTNGIEVLNQMKANPVLANIPVVMQTGATSDDEIIEGIEAGAHYYLTKPFEAEVLLSIVRAALADKKRHKILQDEVKKNSSAISLMEFGTFSFNDPLSAQHLATLLALMCPDPESVVIGLGEPMMNAIEHGNLAIDYDRKGELIDSNSWEDEIQRLLTLLEYNEKRVMVTVLKPADDLEFRISDQGTGFDWQEYIDIEPHRVHDRHVRGIAIANRLSFSSLTYEDNGATAIAIVTL